MVGHCLFTDVPIANDAEALLQDRVLVLRGVGTRHDDFVVIFVAMYKYLLATEFPRIISYHL
jgi:hypothetical protein